MQGRRWTAKAIARAFLAAWPERDRMIDRASQALGQPWSFLFRLAESALARWSSQPPLRRLVEAIELHPAFIAIVEVDLHGEVEESDAELLRAGARLEVRAIALVPQKMQGSRWPVPPLDTEVDLLRLLGLYETELFHLAGLGRRERHRPEGPLRNYHYVWRRKSGGGARLIEAPKLRLKLVQRSILGQILRLVPPHPAATGFVVGQSIHRHAAPHVGRAVVLRLDLSEFFPSISGARVTALFHTLGYPERVAKLLAALCTNAVPRSVLRLEDGLDAWRVSLLSSRHLPAGAPSSPMIANLCAHALDRRLSGLARSFGAHYGRYADDLTFSGDAELVPRTQTFVELASAIAREEGFRVNAEKTRIMRAGRRQSVTGLVVNVRPNVARPEYERLKALLHNAAANGPESQNRAGVRRFREHLRGRIAHVAATNPRRGARLLAEFQRIRWGE